MDENLFDLEKNKSLEELSDIYQADNVLNFVKIKSKKDVYKRKLRKTQLTTNESLSANKQIKKELLKNE